MSRKGSGLLVFVTALGCYLALTVIGLVLMVGGGLGPDVVATRSNRIGSAILEVLFFPLEPIHTRFFLGRPLPGGDWPWIVGIGACWAGLVTLAIALLRRVRGVMR